MAQDMAFQVSSETARIPAFFRSRRGSAACTIGCAKDNDVENPLKMRLRRFSFRALLYMMGAVQAALLLDFTHV